MKKFTKIVVFATALFAFACTTDTTQDLNIGLKGQTTLTLSLEASRTQLGQAVEGLYPLYWSDGDKISINGIESNEAAINSANRSNASFTISEVVETPYCIA
jgi:hypothetical protein